MSKKSWQIIYWISPFVLWLVQVAFTQNSNSQIRYEELADSIRNVFWLSEHKVYDGVSNGVGWYGSLLVVYNLFGFSLFTAKYVRLVLALISLICLAWVLFKYLKPQKALLPILTIGLSPSLLFLNSTQTEYALDLQLLPIYLCLILSLNFKDKKWWWTSIKLSLFLALLMLGAVSYPTFVYYIPVFFILLGVSFRQQLGKVFIRSILRYSVLMITAFSAPLIAIFSYLNPQSRELLYFDSVTNGGIFRGAGSFLFESENFFRNLGGLFRDLFAGGSSYHFEVNQGEFSLIFPSISFFGVIILSLRLIKKGQNSIYLILIWVGLALVAISSSLTLDPSGSSGMRRYTPILGAFYALFVLAWWQADKIKGVWGSWGVRAIFGLLLLHHLIVLPINLAHLSDPSSIKEPLWFALQETPTESFKTLVESVQKEDLKLVCMDKGQPFYCRISEVYGAVAGYCKWNRLDCHSIYGMDFKTGQMIPLSTELWDSYYFEH